MSRRAFLLLVMLLVVVPWGFSQVLAGGIEPRGGVPSRANTLAFIGAVLQLMKVMPATVGIAIAPVASAGVLGVIGYLSFLQSAASAEWHWYFSPLFWGTALLICGVRFLNSTLGQGIPPLKKIVEAALLSTRAVDGVVGVVMTAALVANSSGLLGRLAAASPPVLESGPEVALASMSAFWIAMATAVLAATYVVVWLSSTALDVLALLIPIPLADVLPKLIKWGTALSLLASFLVNPWVAIPLGLVVTYVCARLLGWSSRLVFFGAVTVSDLVRRARGHSDRPRDLRGFSAAGCVGVPVRTWGRITPASDGGLEFSHRRLPFVAESRGALASAPDQLKLGRGTLGPILVCEDPDTGGRVFLLNFPPRYRGHEPWLSGQLGAVEVADMGWRRGMRAWVAWLRQELAGAWERSGAGATG